MRFEVTSPKFAETRGAASIGYLLMAMIVTAVLLAAPAQARTTGDFISAQPIQLPAGYSLFPGSVAFGFLNQDKRLDMVVSVANDTQSAIFSLLNGGNGKFVPVTAVADDGQTSRALADLDGDGKPDLVCTRAYSDPNVDRQTDIDVEVSFGRGDGTFRGTQKYTVIGRFVALEVGDVNGDGKPDLVIGTNGGYQILLNNGGGVFHAAPTFSAPDSFGFTLRDVNGDGRADLLIPESSSTLAVALGTAAGGFATPVTYSTGPNPLPPAVGDINGDGFVDIAVPTNNGVSLLLGNGDGTFHSGGSVYAGPSTSAALADLDKDGKLDLIVTLNSTDQITQYPLHRMAAYPGNGDGSFGSPHVYNVPDETTILKVADVIGDDRDLDVVLTDLTLLPGDGHGALGGAPITRSPGAAGIVTGDFDGDGVPDAAVANIQDCGNLSQCKTTVTVFPGSGSTWLKAGKSSAAGIVGADISVNIGMATGDLDGNGKLDLVLSGGDTQTLSVLLGNGDGTFKAPKLTDLGSNASPEVHLADVNNDGKLDIVLTSGVLLGHGDGTFGPIIPYPSFPSSRGFSAVAAADLNGDGKLDIAAGIDTVTGPYSSDQYGLAILFGDGTGHFTTASQTPTFNFLTQIVPAKMSGHALPDLVVAFGTDLNTVPGEGMGVSVYVNKGDGSFPEQEDVQYFTRSRYFVVGDFTTDGINDVAGLWDDTLVMLPGNGDGTLDAPPFPPDPQTFTAMNGPIAMADFNLDGAPDVVTANPLGISRYINANIPAPPSPSAPLKGVKAQ